MDDPRRSWLRHWHNILDTEVGVDSSFDFDVAYNDPYGDFRMHFVTWDLSDEALHRCFEMLPVGRLMAERAIEMRSLYRAGGPKISEDAAVDMFKAGLRAFSQFSDAPELKKPIRVRHVSPQELNSAVTDRVDVLLEEVEWNIPPENVEVASFLDETLYRLAYSSDVGDYVTWPLIPDPQSVNPYRPFALLRITGSYFPLLDEDGPVLFVRHASTG